MLNLIISIVVAIVIFTVGCVVALQVAPGSRGSTAAALRIGASCALALMVAIFLYVYLEG